MQNIVVFKKLFRIKTEADEGSVLNSISFFESRPYKSYTRALDKTEQAEKGYTHETTVAQYRRRFFIDLWFCELYFSWFTKDLSVK